MSSNKCCFYLTYFFFLIYYFSKMPLRWKQKAAELSLLISMQL